MDADGESEDCGVAWLECVDGSVVGVCDGSDLIGRRNHSEDNKASGSLIEATKPEEVFLTMVQAAFNNKKRSKCNDNPGRSTVVERDLGKMIRSSVQDHAAERQDPPPLN